jgi:hypothetical protein
LKLKLKLYTLLAAALTVAGLGLTAPAASASVGTPAGAGTVESVDRPADHSSGLSFFSCGATRPNPPGPHVGSDLTVNHSHRIASKSSPGHYDWFDCEGYVHPGQDGCVWATYYIYDGDPDVGVFGPFNVTCFGF